MTVEHDIEAVLKQPSPEFGLQLRAILQTAASSDSIFSKQIRFTPARIVPSVPARR